MYLLVRLDASLSWWFMKIQFTPFFLFTSFFQDGYLIYARHGFRFCWSLKCLSVDKHLIWQVNWSALYLFWQVFLGSQSPLKLDKQFSPKKSSNNFQPLIYWQTRKTVVKLLTRIMCVMWCMHICDNLLPKHAWNKLDILWSV